MFRLIRSGLHPHGRAPGVMLNLVPPPKLRQGDHNQGKETMASLKYRTRTQPNKGQYVT